MQEQAFKSPRPTRYVYDLSTMCHAAALEQAMFASHDL